MYFSAFIGMSKYLVLGTLYLVMGLGVLELDGE